MDLKQIAVLALQVSILSTVFGFGLKATAADLLYLVRRPGLLARSLLAVFVIMPVVAVGLVRVFDFPPAVEIVLVALAVSPVPPLLPKKETQAGGHASFALGLMAMLALVSIVAVPAAVEILGWLFGRPVAMSPGAIAGVVLKAALVPLGVGMAVRALLPALATRLEKGVTLLGQVLMPLGVLALLAITATAIWAFTGIATILAIAIFTVAGLGIGHALGGSDPEHAVVLALSTACGIRRSPSVSRPPTFRMATSPRSFCST
jgi:BASS family bile acid:Na+ symporter